MKVGNGGQTVPGGNLADRPATRDASATGDDGVVTETVSGSGAATALTRAADGGEDEPVEPSLPVMPFPTFQNVPTLPQQLPGNGYESGRDSRAR
jgi:hypothetical protein